MLGFSRLAVRRSHNKIRIGKCSTSVTRIDAEDAQLQRTIEKITNITSKRIKRKPQRPPFAKNFFLGICDTDLLAYPEVLDKDQVENLEREIAPVRDFYENISRNGGTEINDNYLGSLNDLKLLGLRASSLDGGRQLTVTETCRFYEEIAKADGKIGIVQSQQLGLQTLLKCPPNPTIKKSIGDLIEGRSVAAFCINESGSLGTVDNRTGAVMSGNGRYWVLNGNKRWMVNGDTADIFIVLTEVANGSKEMKTVALLVRRSDGGITSKPCRTMGLCGTDIADVSFANTPIPIERALAEGDNRDETISTVLSEHRLSAAPISLTVLRKVINKFLQHCTDTDLPLGGNLTETEVVQAKIGELTTSLYAIESLIYLTAGLIDQYEDQDCALETAITKAFSVERCNGAILETMKFLGAATLETESFFGKLYRDSVGHMLLHEPLDGLKIIVALLGLQHAGRALNERVKVMRNPIFHPMETFKRMWTQRQHIADNPKLTLRLSDYLHPSLHAASRNLEYCILRMKFATETLLTRYGPDVVGKHRELKRMADSAIDVYAITAVLARANRSYCIGLEHAAMEMEIAAAFSTTATERVKTNINKVIDGPYCSMDEKHLNIAKYSVVNKRYSFSSPLSRIF